MIVSSSGASVSVPAALAGGGGGGGSNGGFKSTLPVRKITEDW